MFDSILMILVANLQLSAPRLIISSQFSEIQMVQVNAEDLIIQGNEKFKVGDYPGAITDYTEAIRLNSQESRAYYNRAAAAFKLQKVEQTLADLTRVMPT
jgi:tetratricopeptide (TPR) repeat protein